MKRRDPVDERHNERLAGSTLASILMHFLAAAFLISVAASAAQESAPEDYVGGDVTTVSQIQPIARIPVKVTPSQPVPRHVATPVTEAPPPHPVHQPIRTLHELTQVVPSAAPNPTPVPQTTPVPLPVPTQTAIAMVQPTIAPTPRATPQPTAPPTAVPTPIVTPRPQPIVKPAPTVAPTAKPAPTAAPTARPAPTIAPIARPAPTIAPTARPAPTIAPVIANKVAVALQPAPSAAPKPSIAPAAREGVPSPHPVQASTPASGRASPGPQNANLGQAHAKPAPISYLPPPTPRPVPIAHPRAAYNPYAGLNARLNSLIPQSAVTPHAYQYSNSISLAGKLEPTPPPSVLARTRYLFQGPAASDTIKMWVVAVEHRGPILICNGWIVRYPQIVRQGVLTASNVPVGPANGIQIGTQHQVPSGFAAGLDPIVVGMGNAECSMRSLVPFIPPPATQ
jgi:hypothetical protein